MKKQKIRLSKRILSIMLSLLMVVSILPAGSMTVSAASKIATLYWPVRNSSGTAIKTITPGRHFSSSHNGIDINNSKGCTWYAVYSGTVDQVFSGCRKDGNTYDHSKTCDPNHGVWKTNFHYYYKNNKTYLKQLSDGALILYKNRKVDHPEYYERYNIPCNSGAGNGFIIKSKINGTYYYFHYAHMDSINTNIKVGDKVSANTPLGIVGNRGNSYGTHAHFAVSVGTRWNNNIDPETKFDYIYDINYKVTANAATNVTNTSATLNSSLDKNGDATKIRYWISKNKNDLTDATLKKYKKTSTVDYRYAKDYDKATSVKSNAYDIKSILDKPLTPNTTYYYRAGYKINGKMYISSNVASFKTSNSAPASFTFSNSGNQTDIGIGDTATVSWNASKYADTYTAVLKNSSGNTIHSKSSIKGTTYTFPSECFNAADEYKVEVAAVNAVKSTAIDDNVTIVVHNNVTVTFIDEISGSIIKRQEIPYGHGADAPANPAPEGYNFKSWDKKFNNVTENIEVTATYEKKIYTVKFFDGINGKLIKTDKVKYMEVATAPTVIGTKGYVFSGWDRNINSITEDCVLTANYRWYDDDYCANTTIESVKRDVNKDGYNVKVTVNSINDIDKVEGRVVIALVTETGYLLNTTESAAFSLSPNETRALEVFAPCNDLAQQVKVFTVNNYQQAGSIAQPVQAEVNNNENNGWSGWIEYDGSIPVEVGVDGVVDIETKKDSATYRYRSTDVVKSYDTSITGYIRHSYEKIPVKTNQRQYFLLNGEYPANTSSKTYIDKNHKTFKKYNITPKTAVDNETTIITVSDKTIYTYLYWQWAVPNYTKNNLCNPIGDYKGESLSGIGKATEFNMCEKNSKSGWSSTYKGYSISTSESKYSKWWSGRTLHQNNGGIPVYTNTWSEYKKYYTYYKINDWTEWKEYDGINVPVIKDEILSMTNSDYVYDLETNPGAKYYRYKSETPIVAKDVDVPSTQMLNATYNVPSEYDGKEATIFIFKYTQPSDYTNEYIGTATVNNGKIVLSGIKLREKASLETGDFTVVASIKGCSSMIELGKIEAPKPKYTVTYYDFDNNVIYKNSNVTAGATVTAPSADLVHPSEGYRFVRWNQSTVNVQSDLNVYPEQERKTVVVVFVDWVSQEVSLKEMYYGDEIITPVLSQPEEGMTVYWDMSNASVIEDVLDDGTKTQRFIATDNTVITTTFEKIEYTVNFISPTDVMPTENPDDINIDIEELEEFEEADYMSVETANYENAVTIPEFDEDNDDYIFYGWINVKTGEYLENDAVTSNATYYPVYDFARSAGEPQADIQTGEYSTEQTVTLTTETEDAVIYYTTDGSNPKTSSTVKEYTQPITLDKSTTLKFYASGMMMNDSAVITELYAINTATSGVPYHLIRVYSSLDDYNVFYALVRDNAKLNLSSITTIEGGTFDGVFLDEEYTDEFYYNVENVTRSLTLYAKYTLDTHTVTFVDYDGTILGTVSVEYGSTAEIEAPAREGYVFVGWDNDVDYVTEDITATAEYVSEDEYATVKLTTDERSIDVDSYIKLTAIVTPADLEGVRLFWYSEDESIATVDENGYVRAVSPGETKIIVYVNTTGESAECTFIVNENTRSNLIINKVAPFGYDSAGYIRGVGENTNASSVAKYFDNETGVNVYSKDNQLLNDNDTVTTGSLVKLIIDNEVVDTKTIVMTGDVNGDGHIGNADVSMLNQWLGGSIELSDEQQLAGDVNGDGYVDFKDAAVISRYLVGKERIQ